MLRNNIQNLLQDKEVSIRRLSKELDLSYSLAHDIVNRADLGATQLGTLVKIADYLKVGISDLYLLLEGSFNVSSGWVKEHDREIYDDIRFKLEQFIMEDAATEEDLQAFDAGVWEVEYVFIPVGVGSTEILITAGKDSQSIANQDSWIREVVSLGQLVYWPVKKYIELIED